MTFWIPPFREAGSLINQSVTFAPYALLACSHRHHHFSAASVHDDRTRCTQSDPATSSTSGFPACEPRLLSPFWVNLRWSKCFNSGPGVPRGLPLHSKESATADFLVGSAHESLSLSTGVFSWDHPNVASQFIAVCESGRIAQEHFGR